MRGNFMYLRLICLYFFVFESFADCSNLFRESSPSAKKYKALEVNEKNNVIQKYGVSENDYPELTWTTLDSFKMDDLVNIEELLSTNEYQKNSIRDFIKRMNENLIRDPYEILENASSGHNVVIIGKPNLHITLLTDSKTKELLGVDYSITIDGASIGANYRGPIYFKDQESALLRGADINSDVSWNLGGGVAEIDLDELKVIEDDYSITWTGF